MPDMTVDGGTLECVWGDGPKQLHVLPNGIKADGKAIATTKDMAPLANIPSFGQCKSMSNPMVAAATAAAEGVLQPQECIPVIATPWLPGSPTVLLNGLPVLNNTSVCVCAWAMGMPLRVVQSGSKEIHVP